MRTITLASGDSQPVAGAGAHRDRGRYRARDTTDHVRWDAAGAWDDDESVHFNTGEVKFQTKGPVLLATNSVTIQPGGSSGWHFHPGVTLVSVASGTVVRYDAHCMATVFNTGDAFIESGNHPLNVRNEGTTPAVNIVTFIVPAGTTNMGLRIDAPNPGCPQN